MMGIYDNIGTKRKKTAIRLTRFQEAKLQHICELFGVTYQRFFSDCIDYFYMDILEVQAGRISLNKAEKDSTKNLYDEYVDLKKLKGLKPAPYLRSKQARS